MSRSVRLVRDDDLAEVSYAYAAVAPGGLVLTAGACPLGPDGDVVAPGDFPAQARVAMENLVAALAAAGCGLEDVARTTIYVVARERQDLVAVWDVVRAAFGSHDAPSTLLGVSLLGYPDQLVEIEAVAVAPGAGSAP